MSWPGTRYTCILQPAKPYLPVSCKHDITVTITVHVSNEEGEYIRYGV